MLFPSTDTEFHLVKIGLVSAQFTIVVMTFIVAWRLSRNLYRIDLRYFKWFWLVDCFYILCSLVTSYQLSDTADSPPHAVSLVLTIATDLLDIVQSAICFLALYKTDYDFPLRRLFQRSMLIFILPAIVLVFTAVYTALAPVGNVNVVRLILACRIAFNCLAFIGAAFMLRNMTIKIKESSWFLFVGMLIYAAAQLLGIKIMIHPNGTLHDPISGWFLGLVSKSFVFWGLLQIYKNEALRSVSLERLLYRTFHELSNNLYGISTPVKKILNPKWKDGSIDVRAEAREIEKTYETLVSIIESSALIYKNALFDTSSDKDVEAYLSAVFENKKEEARLNTLVEVAVRLSSRFAGKEYKVVCDYGGACRVMCHKHEIIQVIVNLLKNASEAFAGGAGTVHIITRHKFTEGSGDSKQVVMTIEDDGPGIPAEIKNKIFVEGYSTKDRDIGGYGLAIVKDIIESSYGDIRVESPVNTSPSLNPGTKFTITFHNS